MEEGLMLGVPIGILLVILQRLPVEIYKNKFRTAIKWGFWLSVFIVAVRVGTRNAVSREILEGLAMFVALISESIILWNLFKGNLMSEKVNSIFKYSIIAAVVSLFLYHGFEIWLLPVGSITAAVGNYFSIDFLMKILGFFVGVIFAFISSFLVYKAADALNDTRLKFVFAIQFAACMIQQLIL
ncbi:MAG: DUF2318 domain-containing protein, partial [Selenomonadaceae bacterium]|nr:DUF2318 domain-containing protein [Selenomonadaceae bacterium]